MQSLAFFKISMADAKNLEYCPPNITLWNVWVNHGLSQCFMDTVSTSVMTGFLIIFGSIQLVIYRKYATPTDTPPSRSRLYGFQILLLILFPLLAITRFLLQAFVYEDHQLYGFMVSLNSLFFIKIIKLKV